MRAFTRLSSDSAEVVEFKDGEFTVQCCSKRQLRLPLYRGVAVLAEGCRYEQKETDPKAKWSSDKFPIPAIGSKIKASINGQWKGVVTGYFVEHGYQGIEIDCSRASGPIFTRSKVAIPSGCCSSASI